MLNIYRRTRFKNIKFIVGTGSKKLSMCNIMNIKIVVEAIIKEQVPNEPYNISDNIIYSYKSLLNIGKPLPLLKIPFFFIYIIYLFGCLIKNRFIIENSIKLLTDNVYSSEKINSHVNTKYSLNTLK